MGKGSADFRVTQITQSIPLAQQTDEQVKHAKTYREWQLPEHDFAIRMSIKNWILKARMRFHLSAKRLPMPLLSYELKGNILGQAFYREHMVKINPTYLAHSPHRVIDETVAHEIGHLVAFKIYGSYIRPHGKEWQNVCLDMGHYPSVRDCQVPSFKEAQRQLEAKELRELSADDF